MYIIKIGGGVTINHQTIIKGLNKLERSFLVVHGANALRDDLAQKLNCKIQRATSPSGYSCVLTNNQSMDIFLMAYAGLRNKRLVELAQQNNINAIGLTGLDGGLISGNRKQTIRIKENDKVKMIRNDLSGRPAKINTNLIELLVSAQYVPFICPPILSEQSQAINTENDNIVSLLVKELKNINTVIHFMEAPGLLADKDDEFSLIKEIKISELEEAENKYTAGRMKRKMLAVKEAFDYGVEKVIFADGRVENAIDLVLEGGGTIITKF